LLSYEEAIIDYAVKKVGKKCQTVKKKVKQSRYRPGGSQRVPGS